MSTICTGHTVVTGVRISQYTQLEQAILYRLTEGRGHLCSEKMETNTYS